MTLQRILRVLAVVFFAVGWYIATGVNDGWINPTPWELAGLTALAASFLP